VVVLRVEPVVAAFEQGAELDGLVGLVGVHGPQIEADGAEGDGAEDGAEDQSPEGRLGHLAGRP
jgi:hypothetical protein